MGSVGIVAFFSVLAGAAVLIVGIVSSRTIENLNRSSVSEPVIKQSPKKENELCGGKSHG